ncbi:MULTISPECIES: hypothetical protein [Listeria]|uniref:hypothetical protein n=1 Tax=Listeria TaxID=1637 RepID=UPI000B596E69|nr:MULTISPECIES: hypothetical protein [Listeria]
MIYRAEVLKTSTVVEEEVVARIKGVEFTGFIAYAPYQVQENKDYLLEPSLFLVDDPKIFENDANEKTLVRKGDTFSYQVKGYLTHEGMLDIGFIIDDEILKDYGHFFGRYISFQVDRIDLDFQ